MEVRIVKIEFIKDQQDIRPNRNKIIPKGKVLTVTGELADQYIEMGVAKLLDEPTSSNKKLLTKKRSPLFSWFVNLNTSNQIGIVLLVLAIPGALLAVLELGDRYNQSINTESVTLSPQEQSENFDSFLTRFNKDTAFQLSRVIFPHEQQIIAPHDAEFGYLFYDTSNWLHLSFEYKNYYSSVEKMDQLNLLAYEQDTILTEDKVTIQRNGVEQDPNFVIFEEKYIFQLDSGRWYLTYSKDLTR